MPSNSGVIQTRVNGKWPPAGNQLSSPSCPSLITGLGDVIHGGSGTSRGEPHVEGTPGRESLTGGGDIKDLGLITSSYGVVVGSVPAISNNDDSSYCVSRYF